MAWTAAWRHWRNWSDPTPRVRGDCLGISCTSASANENPVVHLSKITGQNKPLRPVIQTAPLWQDVTSSFFLGLYENMICDMWHCWVLMLLWALKPKTPHDCALLYIRCFLVIDSPADALEHSTSTMSIVVVSNNSCQMMPTIPRANSYCIL